MNPEVHIPSLSTKIHGITNDNVKDHATFYEAFSAFLQFIYTNTDHNEHTILIAHNAFGFDVPMLQKEAQRFGVTIPPEFYVYDTLQVYRREFPLRESKKLGDLFKECFGREMENAHDALADSIGLQELFNKELFEKFDVSDMYTLAAYNIHQNDHPVQNISGVGPATAWKIGKFAKTKTAYVQDLRKLMVGKTDEEIEMFIRNDLNQHQESYVFSIWFAVTNGHGHPPSYYFNKFCKSTKFPFYDEVFMKFWSAKTAEVFRSANIRSVEMLRRHYYYVIRENETALRKLAHTVLADFHVVKMLVNV